MSSRRARTHSGSACAAPGLSPGRRTQSRPKPRTIQRCPLGGSFARARACLECCNSSGAGDAGKHVLWLPIHLNFVAGLALLYTFMQFQFKVTSRCRTLAIDRHRDPYRPCFPSVISAVLFRDIQQCPNEQMHNVIMSDKSLSILVQRLPRFRVEEVPPSPRSAARHGPVIR